SNRLGPSAARGNDPPARIACQRARNIGVRRSSSIQRASSLHARGSSCVATVAAMRNLAGRWFSATSRYHDSALPIAGSSQIFSLAKSPTGWLLGFIYTPAAPASISTHIGKRLSPLPLAYAQQVRIVTTWRLKCLGSRHRLRV